MTFAPRSTLARDTGRTKALDQLAQRLETEHGAGERTARLMNLPTWAGYLDAVLLNIGPLPGDTGPAAAGDLLATNSRAHLLGTLIGEGPARRDELIDRFRRMGSKLCPEDCRRLLDADYIRVDKTNGEVSANPAIHTGMATISVHLLEQPTQTLVNSVMELAHDLHWPGGDISPPGHRPPDTAAYLNALGRALEATAGGEHPDIEPAPAVREGWYNALNVR